MKLTFTTVLFAAATLLSAQLDRVAGGGIRWQLDSDELFAPGNDRLGRPLSPSLFDCSNDNGSLHIEYVELDPEPPKAGRKLLIRARGTFDSEVNVGSTALVTVKYGVIQIIKKEFNLCEEIKNADLSCPLGPGTVTVEKEVELPREIPPVSRCGIDMDMDWIG
jgi:hypothetical protein